DGQDEVFFPTFVAVSPDGVFVADTMNARVVEVDKEGKFIRQIGERGDRFGQFDKPKGVATDSFGNLYVVDSFFSAIQIFNRDAKLLLFFAGPGDSPGFLANPAGIAIDAQNRIYVANGLNFRVDVYQLVNTSAEDGLCVFCHTPHKGASSLLLWNHQFSANNYSWADVTGGKTTGGTAYPTNIRQWTGSTAKCLSCHDGTVSVGALYWSNASATP